MTPDSMNLLADRINLLAGMAGLLVVFAVIGLSHLRGIDGVVLRGFSELGKKLDRIEALLRDQKNAR